ncbi:MAG: response regulator receiver domain-containing protein [Candidatus Bathyarchaeota archaeon B26-1]|nr:MAG: response regulator receiver domain-containing protein [Candidatus Bathyarchaeota archaeon B26-1]
MTTMEKKSILIVDDDRAILSSLEKILRLGGYSVDTAETGREAIEKAKNRFYNLMLLDIKLPDMEGTELLRAVDETEPKMVKIMVTGYPSLENAVKSLNLGADAYLMKPIDPQELLDVVEKKLKEQEEADIMDAEKVKEWIKTRIQRLKTGAGE